MGTVDRQTAIRDARASRARATKAARAEVHIVSVRLDHEQYRRLRRFVNGHEDQTGQRVTHQAILEMALNEYLERTDQPSC